MERKRTVSLLLTLTLMFIWGNSLLPREISGAISDWFMDRMNESAEALGFGPDLFTVMADIDGDGTEEPTSRLVRKMAHVAEFALLGALLWIRLDGTRRRGVRAFALGTAAAFVDETLQLFSHRGSQIRDVGIDACGVLLGLCAASILALCLKNRKR